MPAVKKYTRINFQNYPSTSTPLNATNLNKMDKGIDDLDDELVTVKNTIENMSFDADAISYDNTQSGLQATDVQGAVDEINDNLNGFKFYPTGTELVAYIEGHGWYKDADGNYVIWGTATANALVEASPNTYYGRQSEEDLRGKAGADTATPFKSDLTITVTAQGAIWNGTTGETITKTVDKGKSYLLIMGGMAPNGSSFSSQHYITSTENIIFTESNSTGNNNQNGYKTYYYKALSNTTQFFMKGQSGYCLLCLDN